MIAAVIAAGFALQTPREVGLKPNERVVAVDGRAVLSNGITLEFIGACQLASRAPKPWNLGGKPLDEGKTQWFWHALGANPKDVETWSLWQNKGEARTFAIALRKKPNSHVTLPFEAVETLNILSERSGPPDLAKGFSWAVDSFKFEQPQGDSMDLTVEVTPFKAARLFSFDTSKKDWPAGFDFKFAEKRSKAFVATKGKRRDFTVVTYLVTATVPDAWANNELELAASDPPGKDAVPFPLNSGTGDVIDGRVVFNLALEERPGYKRTFELRARTKAYVTFKSIPLHRL